MTDTKTLIARLSSEVHAAPPLHPPHYWGIRLIAILVLYGCGIQLVLSLRADLALQLTRPYFAGEIILLTALILTSSVASVLAMYPDAYQKPKLLLLPYILFALLSCLVISQIFLPPDVRMVMPKPDAHSMECALCIASVALVPTAVIFALLRKGTSVRQYQSGFFTVLAASGIGCLTLRLAEANDSMLHLAGSHYLPTLLFATIGGCIGKWILRW